MEGIVHLDPNKSSGLCDGSVLQSASFSGHCSVLWMTMPPSWNLQ